MESREVAPGSKQYQSAPVFPWIEVGMYTLHVQLHYTIAGLIREYTWLSWLQNRVHMTAGVQNNSGVHRSLIYSTQCLKMPAKIVSSLNFNIFAPKLIQDFIHLNLTIFKRELKLLALLHLCILVLVVVLVLLPQSSQFSSFSSF